jgi:putative transposase
MRQAGS